MGNVTWDWSPVAGALQGLAQQWAQKKQYEDLLKTLGTGMGGGAPSPFGGPSSAPPLPTTARREDDNGMPIPGAPSPIMQAQGGAPQQSSFGGAQPQLMDILRKLPPQIGMPLLMQQLQTQMTPGGIKEVDPTKDLYDNTGRLIRKGAPASEYGTRAQAGVNPETGKPDQFVVDKQGNVHWLSTGVAPKEEQQTEAYRNAINLGLKPGTEEFNEYIREDTLPRPPQTTINNNLGNSLASGVGGGAADILKESRSSAAGAVTAIETGNRILSALDSGKVITGPGASFRLFGAQLFGDPETLKQTRTVIQGLADATLASRGELKGQGQITEYEQKTLEKARSGNIDDLTAQEIRTIVRVNDRLARTRIQKHKSTLSNVKGADVPENFLNIYNVDEPPEYQAPKSAGAPVRIQSPDDYNKLPSGAVYIDPNGVQRTKR